MSKRECQTGINIDVKTHQKSMPAYVFLKPESYNYAACLNKQILRFRKVCVRTGKPSENNLKWYQQSSQTPLKSMTKIMFETVMQQIKTVIKMEPEREPTTIKHQWKQDKTDDGEKKRLGRIWPRGPCAREAFLNSKITHLKVTCLR